ncbi:MAG: GGDEF domain-containing phosphodiesterase [Eggerthellaceae bacterium]|nr:GGDEF domain-containing phosphodiesterase [Eggerthellaceae bacterium]
MGPNFDLHIASAAILAVLFLFAVFGYRLRHSKRFGITIALFSLVSAAVILGIIRASVVAATGLDQQTVPLRMAAVVIQCVASFLLFIYTLLLCRGDQAFRLERVLIGCIPLVVSVGASIALFFVDPSVYSSRSQTCCDKPLYLTVHLCMAFYPVVCVAFAVLYRKALDRLAIVAVSFASAAVLVGIAVELALGGLHPITFGMTIAVLALFVMVDNPLENVDSLTFAYDAAAFKHYVSDLMERRRRFSVVIVTLQHLAMLNALVGAAVADRAIRQVAQQSMRIGRTRRVYRVRDSTFAFTVFSRRECQRVVNELSEYFSHPQTLGFSSVDLDVAVTFAADLDAFNSAEQVVQYADFLTDRLQPGVTIPSDQHALVQEFSRWREIRRYLVHAVENNLVSTYVQPLFMLSRNRFSSFEVLSRLVHPALGRIPADEFIEAAESEGLIAALGRSQLESVCRFASEHARELRQRGIDSVKVNLSPIELMEVGFADNALATMRAWGVEPSLFQFEITETTATRYGEEVSNTIQVLRDAGARICMDDFGSGFANLDSLLTLPFTVVKLDKTLLDNATEDHAAEVLYCSVVQMMKAQGVETVAEGVETAEQDEFVRKLGIDEAQGYFYARPMPIEELLGTIQPIE